jgi:capsular polysaccharide biosynthesis protein
MSTRHLDSGDLPPPDRRGPGEEPIELRRYLDALKRGLPLIAGIVLVVAVSTYLVSRSLTKQYRAQASIVRQQLTAADQGLSVDSLSRELNTLSSLLKTNAMLRAAAADLPGESEGSLRKGITSRVDPNANLIYVTGTASSPARAAAIANGVAQTFLTRQAEVERRAAEVERSELQDELTRLRAEPNSALEIQAVEGRLSDLNVQIASAGTELALAERATPPASPASPHPARNALLGVVLGLLLGALIALGRDQLRPRVGGARELSRLLGLPLLLSVPRVPFRRVLHTRSRLASEREAYRALANVVRYTLPPDDGAQVVLVASAVDGEGKSTVAAALARALDDGGDLTLLVPNDVPRQTRTPLSPNALGEFFEGLKDHIYGYVVVDGPSLLHAADLQALVDRCPNVLYVARAGHITVEQAIDARDLLDRLECRPIGLVVVGSRGPASAYQARGRVAALEGL